MSILMNSTRSRYSWARPVMRTGVFLAVLLALAPAGFT